MAVFTGLLAVVSAIQGFFLFRADKTARITAEAARDTVTTMERNAERQLRAYITVEPGGIGRWELEESPHGRITARNVGHTPAYDVEVAVKTGIVDELPSTDITDTASVITTGDMVIVPGGHQNMAFYPEGTIGPKEFEDVFTGKKAVIVLGYVRYRDIFDKKRRTSFCHFYRGPDLSVEFVRYNNWGNSAT